MQRAPELLNAPFTSAEVTLPAGATVIATVTDLLLLRGYSTGIQILFKGLVVAGFVVALYLRSGENRS